jgi:hypothetical protein
MAAVDISGFIAELKDHAVDHGFHVHDERQFIETYSLRQAFEVDVHPEEACGGPLDLHLTLEVDPRVLLAFEDRVGEIEREFADAEEFPEPEDVFRLPLFFNWSLPPLGEPPDLLVLATELAGVAGPDLPLEIAATDSYGALTAAPERRLSIVGRVQVSLVDVFMGREQLCDVLDRGRDVCGYMLDRASVWQPIEDLEGD